MGLWYKFAIARLSAHASRDERLNVGLIVFDGDRLDVRPAHNLDKIRAISAALDSETIRHSLRRLVQLDTVCQNQGRSDVADRFSALQMISSFEFSPLSEFESQSRTAYEQTVSKILKDFVEPERALPSKPVRRSRLLSSLKAAFRNERVLAKKGEDLSAHRIVPSWPLAEGLAADLVLKNGAMHIIETVDAQSDELSLRRMVSDIAVSALVLEQARILFGKEQTNCRLVYSASASNEVFAKPALYAAENQGAQLINWASHDDRNRFVTEISLLASPIETNSSKRLLNVNSSVQPKLNLN